MLSEGSVHRRRQGRCVTGFGVRVTKHGDLLTNCRIYWTAMPDKKAILQAASGYLKDHPEELVRALKSAAAMRIGLPLDALRWFAAQAKGRRAPKNVEIE